MPWHVQPKLQNKEEDLKTYSSYRLHTRQSREGRLGSAVLKVYSSQAFLSFQAILQPNTAAHILQILCRRKLIRETEENVLSVRKDSRNLCIFQSKTHLTKRQTHEIPSSYCLDKCLVFSTESVLLCLFCFLALFFPSVISLASSFLCSSTGQWTVGLSGIFVFCRTLSSPLGKHPKLLLQIVLPSLLRWRATE